MIIANNQTEGNVIRSGNFIRGVCLKWAGYGGLPSRHLNFKLWTKNNILNNVNDGCKGEIMSKSEKLLMGEIKRNYEILNKLPVPLYLINDDFSIKFSNQTFQGKFGNPDGRKCYETVFGISDPCGKCPNSRVMKTGKTAITGFILPNRRECLVYSAPFKLAEKQSAVTIGVLIDVTAHKRAEESLCKLRYESILGKHHLTPQERKVVNYILGGKNDKYIGKKLCISINTVKRHIQSAYRKTGVHSRIELMATFNKKLKLF